MQNQGIGTKAREHSNIYIHRSWAKVQHLRAGEVEDAMPEVVSRVNEWLRRLAAYSHMINASLVLKGDEWTLFHLLCIPQHHLG